MAQRSNARRTPTDAIEMLKADHQKVKDLFQKYERAKDAKTQQNVADQICAELELHAQLEETVFYPAFEEAADEEGEKLVEEARQEHQTVKDLMAELEEIDDAEAFDRKFRELMENVQHHVEEEEAEMFPEAEDVLEEQLEDLLQEMQELKQQLTATNKR